MVHTITNRPIIIDTELIVRPRYVVVITLDIAVRGLTLNVTPQFSLFFERTSEGRLDREHELLRLIVIQFTGTCELLASADVLVPFRLWRCCWLAGLHGRWRTWGVGLWSLWWTSAAAEDYFISNAKRGTNELDQRGDVRG